METASIINYFKSAFVVVLFGFYGKSFSIYFFISGKKKDSLSCADKLVTPMSWFQGYA